MRPALESDLLIAGVELDQSVLDSPLYQALQVVQAEQALQLTEPSSGAHWRNYVEVTRLLLAELDGRDLRTDIV